MTVTMAAKNAAFLVFASKYPNSDLVYSQEFMRALDEALEAAAPHMLAAAWEEGVGYSWQYETPSTDENPYRPTP